ncbi:excalibur calcium-binding domain-containing protein [Streptomyces sp. NPDC090445]|uniref:excalibur calcium-binding domain-containing protein n=1 Tax=Streptomyces sp. NPDC090445 TaxID=3365963 RepID=UPI00381EA9A0
MAAAVGAVVALAGGCQDPASADKGKGADKPSAATAAAPSPSATGPVMPAVVGQKFADAEAAVKKLVTAPIEARSGYVDVKLAADHAQWSVCFQTPAAQSPVSPATAVELSLVAPGTPCPAQAGATLRPSKAPATPTASAPKPAASKPASGGSSGGGSGGSSGGVVVYKSCAEAKAAGAAPIRRGQPGYSRSLDRDNDGIACDK